jgi:hypothetical protein
MTGRANPKSKTMTSEYVLRKNRIKGGKSTRGPPGIGFNLTENSDYDIAEHKLVPTLLYGIEVSYYSLIVCVQNCYHLQIKMAEKRITDKRFGVKNYIIEDL